MPWLPCSYVDQGWSCCARSSSCKGPQAPDCVSPNLNIIKSGAEISLIFKEGKRISTSDITLIVVRNEKQHDQGGRAAFVAGKRLGNAVWRNRAKRRMRALYRETESLFNSYDVIFLAKKSINDASFDHLITNVKHAMKRECI